MILELLFSLFLGPQNTYFSYGSQSSVIVPSEKHITFNSAEGTVGSESIPKKLSIIGGNSVGVKVSAQSALVVDRNTGSILYEKNSNDIHSVASITKLMTALVFLDYRTDLDATITFKEADEHAGAYPHIYRGETVQLRDVLAASLIGSDNNSAYVLARATGLTKEQFVDAMNNKARELGMFDSYFVDPTGLEVGNVSTVKDLSRLLHVTSQVGDINAITSQSGYTIVLENSLKKRLIYNTNQLLGSYINKKYRILHGKTGYIPEAGYCLGLEVEKNEKNGVYIIVLGSETTEDRFQDVKVLSEWVFDNYVW